MGKIIFRKNVLFVMALLCFGFSHAQFTARGKANKDTKVWNYEVECSGVGNDGNVLIKVWSYSRKPKIAIEQAKKNAVHGILFKGYASGASGCTAQRAIAPDPGIEEDKQDFFKDFFSKGGQYLKYVSTSTDASSREVLKVTQGRMKYKVGVTVTVHKDVLRKYLEKEGVIKGLATGF